MTDRNFCDLLNNRWADGNFVCVGLDPDVRRIPHTAHISVAKRLNIADTIVSFNRQIVEATKDLACAYKPNAAFYERYGNAGWDALQRTICMIQKLAPEVPIVLDAKRGDIGDTNTGYVVMAFDQLKADAITIPPYLGVEANAPFLNRSNKGIFILCRTSNPGADEFQDIPVATDWAPSGTMPLYQYVAGRVARNWNANNNCGLVVGATYPQELGMVRQIVDDMPILIPGIGAQGGDLDLAVKNGRNSRNQGIIINSSRGIIYASDKDDFAEAARRETDRLRAAILASME